MWHAEKGGKTTCVGDGHRQTSAARRVGPVAEKPLHVFHAKRQEKARNNVPLFPRAFLFYVRAIYKVEARFKRGGGCARNRIAVSSFPTRAVGF